MLFFQNQVQREITYTMKSIPFMGLLTCACFLAEIHGYSRLYDNVDDLSFGKIFFYINVSSLKRKESFLYWLHSVVLLNLLCIVRIKATLFLCEQKSNLI